MGNYTALSDDYCPACGSPVQTAEKLHSDTELSLQGTLEMQDGHVVIEGTEIRLYEHGGGKS